MVAVRGRRALAVRASGDDAFANYKPTIAALFPGQGAQSVGMAKDLVATVPKAKEMFDKASEILGYDLLKVCVEGPKEKLDSTAVSQPAIYVASLAAVEKLRADEGQVRVLGFEGPGYARACDVWLGGASVRHAAVATHNPRPALPPLCAPPPSARAHLISLCSHTILPPFAATEQVGQDKPVQIANYLCPGNYAVSGSKEGCDAVEKLGKSFGARMTVRLAVAGAFHTSYMSPAVDKLKAALAQVRGRGGGRVGGGEAGGGRPHSDPAVIKDILSRQVTSPVLWENTIKSLQEKGLTKSYEVGPGKVIAGIVKRMDKGANIVNITA
eukprot:XP_001689862.1 malonyl-CoA:acyl-carrier-protein transacylase [Chlamydomonas reinhardtii]